MTTKQIAALSIIPATGLWIACGLLGFVLIANASSADLDAVTRVAELGRDKDIVTLALTLTIGMVGLVGFLIRSIFARWDAAITELGKMRAELSRRPCIYEAKA